MIAVYNIDQLDDTSNIEFFIKLRLFKSLIINLSVVYVHMYVL